MSGCRGAATGSTQIQFHSNSRTEFGKNNKQMLILPKNDADIAEKSFSIETGNNYCPDGLIGL